MIAAHKLVKVSDLADFYHSAQWVNKKLAEAGLQAKNTWRLEDDEGRKYSRWVPTERGRKYCKEFEYKITSHYNGVPTLHWGFYLRWHPDILYYIGVRP